MALHDAFSAPAWLAVLLDAAAKGLVLLLVAGAAALALRRASAAVRHMVWSLAVAGLLLLPVLSAALPQWQVPILPDRTAARDVVPPADPAAAAAMPAAAGEVFAGPAGALEYMPPTAAPSSEGLPDQPASLAAHDGGGPRWPEVVLGVWLAGAAALLVPLAAGTFVVRRQVRGARRIEEGPWVGLLEDLRRRLGIGRRVALLRVGRSAIPVTCGILRAKILLPPDADGWSADRRRAVLLHELAHIRRADCLTQLLARLARVLHWFNPLVWLAGRRLRIEREQACDDLVLTGGLKASDYAQHLLDIVRSLHAARFPSPAAVAMARPGRLEGRLRAILDPRRSRRALTGWGVLAAVVLVAAV
ncbi:MAG: M56 family metallopeptidase, partial [Planctomycetes bacterium]|nr:M56 family metallopeptidase [Planctomycetota bacterium]